MSPDFYQAFEDRHRGSRELIKERLRFYLPYIEPFKALQGAVSLLDLGCGRGEWLELTGACGFAASGIDLDAGMLGVCRALGLDVQASDAVEYLKQLPAQSQAVVSGFHIAEHLPFGDLQTLVQEAFRVLVPTGLLILETPNPENLVVGTSGFYLDPTHNKPLPPALLSFAIEFAGFQRVKTVRLQEDHQLADRLDLGLADVLRGASPDYAIIAQKAASPGELAAWDAAFGSTHGCTLDDLAVRYDGRLSRLADEAGHARQLAQQAEAALRLLQTTALQAVEAARQAQADATRAGEAAALATAMAHQAAAGLSAVQRSVSWRVTAPLRWVRRLLRGKAAAGNAEGSNRP